MVGDAPARWISGDGLGLVTEAHRGQESADVSFVELALVAGLPQALEAVDQAVLLEALDLADK